MFRVRLYKTLNNVLTLRNVKRIDALQVSLKMFGVSTQ